jgi:hypothetical protein
MCRPKFLQYVLEYFIDRHGIPERLLDSPVNLLAATGNDKFRGGAHRKYQDRRGKVTLMGAPHQVLSHP